MTHGFAKSARSIRGMRVSGCAEGLLQDPARRAANPAARCRKRADPLRLGRAVHDVRPTTRDARAITRPRNPPNAWHDRPAPGAPTACRFGCSRRFWTPPATESVAATRFALSAVAPSLLERAKRPRAGGAKREDPLPPFRARSTSAPMSRAPESARARLRRTGTRRASL
jgi:hypothetical protein